MVPLVQMVPLVEPLASMVQLEGANCIILINTSNLFLHFYFFYVYILVFLLFANIIIVKIVIICKIYNSKS